MKNEYRINQIVRQVTGPCEGKRFVVEDIDGNLLHVRLLDPPPGYAREAQWSHHSNYIPVDE